jgi:hypothetical protein
MTDWSAAKLKAEDFEDIDFDHIVTDEAMRCFLRYTILRNKKMMKKRGKGKKKGDASNKARKSPRQPARRERLTLRPWPQRRRSRLLLWWPLSREGCLQ